MSKLRGGDARSVLRILYNAVKPKAQANAENLVKSMVNRDHINREYKERHQQDQLLAPEISLLKKRTTAQLPLRSALQKITTSPSKTVSVSHVLSFTSANSLIKKIDIKKLYPEEYLRQFSLDSLPNEEIDFDLRRGRYPDYLLPNGKFYLIFNSAEEAACFMLETQKKRINGLKFDLKFVSLEDEFQYIYSPLLGEMKQITSFSEKTKQVDWRELYKTEPRSISAILSSKNKLPNPLETLISQVRQTTRSTGRDYETLDVERGCCALVKGAPLTLKKEVIIDELWEYELYPYPDKAVELLFESKVVGLRIVLIRFTNPSDAEKFVARYHGDKFNRASAPFNPTLTCEVMT